MLAAHDPQTFRERLDQDELLRLSGLDPASLARLSDKDRQALGTGTVIIDDRRRRPLYFDGRFLAARDLTHASRTTSWYGRRTWDGPGVREVVTDYWSPPDRLRAPSISRPGMARHRQANW